MTTFEKPTPANLLEDENLRLRQIISEVAAALPNEAFVSPTCSLEFMAGLPYEVSLVVASLSPEPKAETPPAGMWSPIRFEPLRQGNWNDAPGMGQEADGNYVRFDDAQREIDRQKQLIIEERQKWSAELQRITDPMVSDAKHASVMERAKALYASLRSPWLAGYDRQIEEVDMDRLAEAPSTPSPEPQMVGIKPLEWGEERDARITSDFGYYIEKRVGLWMLFSPFNDVESISESRWLPALKTDAQADYEIRIRSALSATKEASDV